MEPTHSTRWFLGANSKNGFYSLYDDFTAPRPGEFLRVIKGGPGCGKSTLMRRIGQEAEARGLEVEYILCSGDPDSLDGIRILGSGLAYVDGTAPHVIEAALPGAADLYLDMSRFLDTTVLTGKREELAALNRSYKACYAEAYALLQAGAALLPKNVPGLLGESGHEKLDKKLAGLAARELPHLHKPGNRTRRFVSAVSCQGRIMLTDTLLAGDSRLCLLDNTLGIGSEYLRRLVRIAEDRGYDLTLCPDPLEPEKPEAVLLPEAGLSFLAADTVPELPRSAWRRLRLDTLAERSVLERSRDSLRRRKKESARLLNSGISALARAKALHDDLEKAYRGHVDFDGASRLAEEQIALL